MGNTPTKNEQILALQNISRLLLFLFTQEHKLRLHEKRKFSPRNTSWLQKEQKLSVCKKIIQREQNFGLPNKSRLQSSFVHNISEVFFRINKSEVKGRTNGPGPQPSFFMRNEHP
jgi:hypothetical protein